MTNFLHWRKMTCALVLWSGYVVAWTVITGSGAALFTLWWLAGTIGCCSLWVATQPYLPRHLASTGSSSGSAGRAGAWPTSRDPTRPVSGEAMQLEVTERRLIAFRPKGPGDERWPARRRDRRACTGRPRLAGVHRRLLSRTTPPRPGGTDRLLGVQALARRRRGTVRRARWDRNGARGATAVRRWEDEGGATLSPDAP